MLASTVTAAQQYESAIKEARKLHPGAAELTFKPAELEPVLARFRELQPKYALVFITPDELDVNFAWRWLAMVTRVDADPFVDVRTGFITGRNPDSAAAFVRRIQTALETKAPVAGCVVDDLGPNQMAAKNAFYQSAGNFMAPVLGQRMGLSTISHGTAGLTEEHLGSMQEAGIVHFGGHGHPERVDDGITADQARQVKLGPCLVFNGACYTGVTGTWYDIQDSVQQQNVPLKSSFCLALLENNVLGYLAALHPDHGIPVYQEMEYLATDGGSLGDIIKHTYDGVILANGAKLPSLDFLSNSAARPSWSIPEIMLNGTASRVLFGDPALVLTPPFAAPPFDITVRQESHDECQVVAVLKNPDLKSTFTDTYYSDLSAVPNLFNDRALITCRLPDGWNIVRKVDVTRMTVKTRPLKWRLVGFGVEHDGTNHLLHVQVDLPTDGFMQSAFRASGATLELKVLR